MDYRCVQTASVTSFVCCYVFFEFKPFLFKTCMFELKSCNWSLWLIFFESGDGQETMKDTLSSKFSIGYALFLSDLLTKFVWNSCLCASWNFCELLASLPLLSQTVEITSTCLASSHGPTWAYPDLCAILFEFSSIEQWSIPLSFYAVILKFTQQCQIRSMGLFLQFLPSTLAMGQSVHSRLLVINRLIGTLSSIMGAAHTLLNATHTLSAMTMKGPGLCKLLTCLNIQ